MGKSSRKGTPRKGKEINRTAIVIVVVAGLIITAVIAFAPGSTPSDEDQSQEDEYAREADRHYIVGLAAYRQQDWPRAVLNFEAALSYEPEHLDAREHLGLARSEDRNQQTLERARTAAEAGRVEEAAALIATIPTSSIYTEQVAELRQLVSGNSSDGGNSADGG